MVDNTKTAWTSSGGKISKNIHAMIILYNELFYGTINFDKVNLSMHWYFYHSMFLSIIILSNDVPPDK